MRIFDWFIIDKIRGIWPADFQTGRVPFNAKNLKYLQRKAISSRSPRVRLAAVTQLTLWIDRERERFFKKNTGESAYTYEINSLLKKIIKNEQNEEIRGIAAGKVAELEPILEKMAEIYRKKAMQDQEERSKKAKQDLEERIKKGGCPKCGAINWKREHCTDQYIPHSSGGGGYYGTKIVKKCLSCGYAIEL
ncbi:MAG: hypothetical protein LBV12_04320 [Puniceicoccales bacterium]|jgi:RNase P subunit RPR2|nr:hypothetical protein [Puniceicoccales bacterium]